MLTDVTDKEVEVPKVTTPALRSPTNKLSTPSRVTAYSLGIASLGAGGVAVFTTHVEAGPVALLFVGLIFMIVALSGRLPTRLRIGESEAEWQDVAGAIIETAVDASPPSVKAEIVPQLEELVEVAPRAAAPALSGFLYESSIEATIARTASTLPEVEQVRTRVMVDRVGEFDLAIEATRNRLILVEIKSVLALASSRIAGIFGRARAYREAHPELRVGLLLVTRYELSASAGLMFAQDPDAACIMFRGQEDEGALIGAINGLLSGLG
jgi:hypothetical protein